MYLLFLTGQKRKIHEALNGEKTGYERSSKVSKQNLYKPPTNEELNTLKESEKVFQSSLFRLQVSFSYKMMAIV